MTAAEAGGSAMVDARRLARSRPENFHVLSCLVPRDLRDDFAALYWFCRTADDLADEGGTGPSARAEALRRLAAFRVGLRSTAAGVPPDADWGPLAATILGRALPVEPFDSLLDAFESDQRITRHERWDGLIGYCRGSADPVGHLVLMLGGYRPPAEDAANAERYRLSDLVCSALQLTNFWQDVRRDLVERDRVYLPVADTGLDAATLRAWMDLGSDSAIRARYAAALAPLVVRTRAMFDEGGRLPGLLDDRIGPVVRLFIAGGEAVLTKIERGGCATLWHRPRLGPAGKAWLLARETLRSGT